eukprot:CAMPEP_0202052108 /NCGR_PEP_ID=MMETSP0963-20130614/5048_1 /ASSEMBLY_ACC=CAM_ASM_000494 /TAXON_ID=4773 /ORGANISM="Schizochytrium aggregatum, Strain ATCC28209" /LENGTH=74 /DNA_ID=CAMNT_0048617341 /DNA_START=210 /DNA_END=434 /DNA_ORIENTATION=-
MEQSTSVVQARATEEVAKRLGHSEAILLLSQRRTWSGKVGNCHGLILKLVAAQYVSGLTSTSGLACACLAANPF